MHFLMNTSCKRLSIVLSFLAVVYILFLWKNDVPKSHNKWKLNRSGRSGSEVETENYKDCQPRKKVAFLKTHKCASTSIQNILLRFGRKHDLNFVLPVKGNILGNHVPFHRDMIKGTLWEEANLKYDMFLVHTRWKHSQISSILEDKGDVIYISIVRDPVELFRSWWDYQRLDKRYKKTLEEYAMSVNANQNLSDGKRPFGFNQMLYDFGMEFRDMRDEEKIQQTIQDIDETFDIILLADKEYFEDSIILLKDVLCWDYRDMVNFKLNSKKQEMKSSLSAAAEQELREWMWADSMFYDHFKKKFLRERESYGIHQLNHEKEILAHANDHVKQTCIEGQVDNKLLPKKDRLYGADVMAYKLKENAADSLCPYYTMKELSFLNDVRDIQETKSIDIIESRELPKRSGLESIKDDESLLRANSGAIWVNPDEYSIQELEKKFKFKKSS